MRRHLFAITVALAGCKGTVPLTTPEADFIALVQLQDGLPLSATPLVPWTPGTALPVITEGDAVVIGFTAQGIQSAGLIDIVRRGTGQLRPAIGCEQALPPPVFAMRWQADGTLTDHDGEIRLTSNALIAGCDNRSPDARIAVDMRCPSPRCIVETERLARCRWRLGLPQCGEDGVTTSGIGEMFATLHADDTLCLEFGESPWVCEPRPDDLADGAMMCSAPKPCPLEVYLEPGERPRPFTTKTATVVHSADYISSLVGGVPLFFPRAVLEGLIFDLAVLDGRVVVTAGQDDTGRDVCAAYRHRSSRLFFVDSETVEVVGTATAPPCIHRLAPDPMGPGFIAPFERDDRWHVGRFDAEGELVDSGDSQVTLTSTGNIQRRIEEMLLLPDSETVVLLQTARGDGGHLRANLIVHDLSSLRRQRSIAMTEITRAWHMHRADPGWSWSPSRRRGSSPGSTSPGGRGSRTCRCHRISRSGRRCSTCSIPATSCSSGRRATPRSTHCVVTTPSIGAPPSRRIRR